jgi:hypothetical protein
MKKISVGTGVSPVRIARKAADKVSLPNEGVNR